MIKRIIIVEDDPVSRAYLVRVCRAEAAAYIAAGDVEVESYERSRDAVDAVEESPDDVVGVLTDVMFPADQLSGPQLVEAVTSIVGDGVAWLIATGASDPHNLGMLSGVAPVLQKGRAEWEGHSLVRDFVRRAMRDRSS